MTLFQQLNYSIKYLICSDQDLVKAMRRNPFKFRHYSDNLLLLTDLDGEIVHISGKTKIINKTNRTLFRKNFFKHLLAKKTKYQLYNQFKSHQILPSWLNERFFDALIKIQSRQNNSKQQYQLFNIKCFRTCVKFSPIFYYFKNILIKKKRTERQFEELKQKQNVQQLIMIYIEPSKGKKVDEEKYSAESIKNHEQASNKELKYQQMYKNMKFQTPKKKQKAQQLDTNNSKEIRKISPVRLYTL